MLRFAVFDDAGPATEWLLLHAHLLGPDDVGLEGEVTFEDGHICCQRRGSGAFALGLQYDAGAAGVLMLQTCLLPDSDRAYVLSHELARHRIKMFLAKCEEWQMFELSNDHPAMVEWERARQLFTLGLNARDRVEKDRFGRESIAHAIDATERLALAHAEVLLHRRYATRPASGTAMGARISTKRDPQPFSDLLAREFDVLYVPLPWRELEPAETQYDWGPTDRWLAFAQQNKRPVIAGPLLDFSPEALPDWMHVWQHDYDTCRNMVYDHVERVVMRYGNVVSIWSIAAGLNVNDNFEFTADQMLDLTRMASLLVREKLRRSKIMLEIVCPFGEFVTRQRHAMPTMQYIDRVAQAGIKIDCYGLQLPFGDRRGLPARDLMQISNLLDRFFMLELPVLITRLGVPSAVGTGESGYWQQPWSPEVQANFIKKMLGIALSKPHVESVLWAELYDHAANHVPAIGVIDAEGRKKPALQAMIDVRRRLRKPLGPLKLPMRGAVRAS
ncbi:MAG: endo-1,4-beta-xylanase [Phycisphaerales bacterium]